MRRIATILAYLCLCVHATSQYAEPAGQCPFVHYTPKDGLVNSRVNKAYQDSKGRMYFLTAGGLTVFDGVRFKNYTTRDGLASDIVNDILEVGDDSLLVATNSGNFMNVLVRGKIGRLVTEGVTCPLINQFCPYRDGKICLASDFGLFMLENRKVYKLDISQICKNGASAFLSDISCEGDYVVISRSEMAHNSGLFLYDIRNNTICNSFEDEPVYLVGKDSDNLIWISYRHNLFVLDKNALKKGKLVMVDPPGAYRRVKNYSSASVAFGKNCIWFMYRNEDFRNIEIHRIDRTGNVVRIPLPQPARSSAIREIIVDKENTIWLCSDGDGIFKILDSPLRIFSNPIVEVTGSVVNHVFYSGNNTWFSTPTNKLVRKSQMGLQVVKTNLEQSPEIFYEGNTLLAHDSRDIYEGTLDGAGTVNFRAIISLPDTDFFQKKIIVYGKNTIIAAQDRFLTVWKNRKPIVQIPIDKNDGIEEIFVDQFNLLWLVTRFNGIQVFTIHPEDRASYLTPVYHYSKNNILGSPRSFVIDKTGLIWIGTRSDGLVGYKQAADRLLQVCHFDVSDGLTDNFISSLACDSSNNIVVGAQTGLDRILRERNGQYRIENVSKGGNFFGMISQAWADKEKSYALTSAGVLLELSRPAEVSQGFTPQLLLEEMRVNGSPASVAGVNFSHNQNNLSFFLAAPSFIDEKQVTYAYLLEGSGNRHWSDTNSANAMINLTNLSAGKYRLFVKAFFPSTYYPPAQLSYSFAIEPPFWRTWWARSIAALLLTTLVLVIARFYYRRKLEKQKQSLERQQLIEKERTRIATNMHDDLGAGLSRIKFLSQSILNKKINDQGIKIELEKITSFSDEMSEKMGDIVWALNEKNDTLADLVAYTRSYAMEYLANHNIHCDAKTPLNLPGNFVTGETRRNIFLSVKECLHNVVKHSRASNVSFTVELNGLMQIVIHDNGKGIDVDNRRAFSNGIENIRKRMKEINGDVEFSNDKGTRVTLTIPLTL